MLVICNGMERSGSTLQYNIARKIVESKGLGRNEGYPFTQNDWNKGAELLHQWQLSSDWVVIKAHSIHPDIEDLVRDKNTRVLYIFRDPRDMAASVKEYLNIGGSELLKKVDEFLIRFERIIQIETLTVQRYETVMADPANAVRQIAFALSITLSNEEVNEIAEACSIHTMEKVLSRRRGVIHRVKGFAVRLLIQLRATDAVRLKSTTTNKELLHPNHFSNNKGKSGTFKSRLTPDECKDMEERYLRWLRVLKNSPHGKCLLSNETPRT